jgi:hypothetical protein
MRSKFIVQILKKADGTFPTDIDLQNKIREYGWEPPDIAKMESTEEKLKAYRERAQPLFTAEQMPEVAQEELEDVIFFGAIRADQTRFVVTRTPGELTFRLIQAELPMLISATEKLLKAIGATNLVGLPLKRTPHNVIDNKILIYEKGHNHVILQGRVVESPFFETLRTNQKDAFVILLVLLFLMLRLISHTIIDFKFISAADFDKLTFSILAVSLVSLIGLVLTFIGIRRHKLVSWNLTSSSVALIR